MGYLSGKSGYVRIGSSAGPAGDGRLPFNTWKLAMASKSSKVTNFTTRGYRAVIPSIVSGTLSVSAPYHSLAMNPAFTPDTEPTNGPPVGASTIGGGARAFATAPSAGPFAGGSATGLAVGVAYVWVLGLNVTATGPGSTGTINIEVTAFIESMQVDNDVQEGPKLQITARTSGSFLAYVL